RVRDLELLKNMDITCSLDVINKYIIILISQVALVLMWAGQLNLTNPEGLATGLGLIHHFDGHKLQPFWTIQIILLIAVALIILTGTTIIYKNKNIIEYILYITPFFISEPNLYGRLHHISK
ncbi:hypothetical protein ACJX0J_007496, partial [Zea mays]